MDEQWEFCTAYAHYTTFKSDARRGTWMLKVDVRYIGEEDYWINVSEEKQQWSFDPWYRVLGLLGASGWELVSVQHDHANISQVASYRDIIAYFKRPKKLGRQVNEPKLLLR